MILEFCNFMPIILLIFCAILPVNTKGAAVLLSMTAPVLCHLSRFENSVCINKREGKENNIAEINAARKNAANKGNQAYCRHYKSPDECIFSA